MLETVTKPFRKPAMSSTGFTSADWQLGIPVIGFPELMSTAGGRNNVSAGRTHRAGGDVDVHDRLEQRRTGPTEEEVVDPVDQGQRTGVEVGR